MTSLFIFGPFFLVAGDGEMRVCCALHASCIAFLFSSHARHIFRIIDPPHEVCFSNKLLSSLPKPEIILTSSPYKQGIKPHPVHHPQLSLFIPRETTFKLFTQTKTENHCITTTTSTSFPHPATNPISLHAVSISISSTFPLTRTVCGGMG